MYIVRCIAGAYLLRWGDQSNYFTCNHKYYLQYPELLNKYFMLTRYSPSKASCSFQPCVTLNQHLLDDNGSMPVVSNFEYYILPGEHHVLYSGKPWQINRSA